MLIVAVMYCVRKREQEVDSGASWESPATPRFSDYLLVQRLLPLRQRLLTAEPVHWAAVLSLVATPEHIGDHSKFLQAA
jgi:hypothetical protein